MTAKIIPQCAKCSVKDSACTTMDGNSPDYCPMKNQVDVLEAGLPEYQREGILEFAQNASRQEAENYLFRKEDPDTLYPSKPRVQEVCEFAHKMGYKRLGIAFCRGLRQEAKSLNNILEAQGFEVASACCKAGGVSKDKIGLTEEEQVRIGRYETMCNPIIQAKLLNDSQTDFNLLLGLCVGHDSLFFKYSEAMTSVIAVKDRVLGHNPCAALYQTGSYYQRLMKPGFGTPQKD